MSKPYGIIGHGDASDEAIIAALNDVDSKATFYILKNCKATAGQSAVYNWLIDYERAYSIYGTTIGPVLREGAEDSGEGTVKSVIDKVKKDGGDTVLILWDDTEEVEEAIFYADSQGMKVLELTNGLAPIEVDGTADTAAKEEVVEQDDEEEHGEFTRAEMENMPAAAVKRHATTKGIDIKGMTKADIIDALFPMPEVAADLMGPVHFESVITAPEVANDDVVQITICYRNGAVVNLVGIPTDIASKMLSLVK